MLARQSRYESANEPKAWALEPDWKKTLSEVLRLRRSGAERFSGLAYARQYPRDGRRK